jgi:hypothetical protein
MCSDEVSWPAGALEEQDYESGQQGEHQLQLTREQVEQEQELMEKQTQDRCAFFFSYSLGDVTGLRIRNIFFRIRIRIRIRLLKNFSAPTLIVH